MTSALLRALFAAAMGWLAGNALAQARPQPLDPSAPVPSVVYRSSLSEHRAYRASEVGAWRDANETVNRIGGWRTYAREAEAAAPTPLTAPAKPPSPQIPPAHRHR